VSFFPYKKES